MLETQLVELTPWRVYGVMMGITFATGLSALGYLLSLYNCGQRKPRLRIQ
jgi:hypothetical protein